MLRRHNRLLVAFHVVSDALLGVSAFILAYAVRFHTNLIPITKGVPPLRQYINVLPFVALLVPFAFQLQGLYRLRRGRSRVDDFFAVFVGSILAVVFGIVATLYVQTYFATNAAKDRGAFEVSQLVWAVFLVFNVTLTYASRELVREVLERRWRAGIGLKRILIAGSGELGRLVADKILEHRELGYQIVGFVDDRAGGRSPRVSRVSAARHAGRSRRNLATGGGRPSVRGAAARPAREDARADREHEPRVRRRQGGARPAPGHRPARAARGSGRRSGHQHQRRPAAGIQQRPQARHRHRDLGAPRWWCWRCRSPSSPPWSS